MASSSSPSPESAPPSALAGPSAPPPQHESRLVLLLQWTASRGKTGERNDDGKNPTPLKRKRRQQMLCVCLLSFHFCISSCLSEIETNESNLSSLAHSEMTRTPRTRDPDLEASSSDDDDNERRAGAGIEAGRGRDETNEDAANKKKIDDDDDVDALDLDKGARKKTGSELDREWESRRARFYNVRESIRGGFLDLKWRKKEIRERKKKRRVFFFPSDGKLKLKLKLFKKS
jgi:hypothetical protein